METTKRHVTWKFLERRKTNGNTLAIFSQTGRMISRYNPRFFSDDNHSQRKERGVGIKKTHLVLFQPKSKLFFKAGYSRFRVTWLSSTPKAFKCGHVKAILSFQPHLPSPAV
jgi:hypothetical protein